MRIGSFNDFSLNHYELIDPDSVNAKLSLLENCNLVGATPIEDYKYYTASQFTLSKISTSFIAENKQFIIFIASSLADNFKTSELYDGVDMYAGLRLNKFWETSKSNTFKNITYPNYTLDPLSTVGENPTGLT